MRGWYVRNRKEKRVQGTSFERVVREEQKGETSSRGRMARSGSCKPSCAKSDAFNGRRITLARALPRRSCYHGSFTELIQSLRKSNIGKVGINHGNLSDRPGSSISYILGSICAASNQGNRRSLLGSGGKKGKKNNQAGQAAAQGGLPGFGGINQGQTGEHFRPPRLMR
jgi:hypothetical protein